MMEISEFGKKIGRESGIGRLMDDLCDALARGKEVLMLGGGNPAHIAEMQKYFRRSAQGLLDNDAEFERTIGDYDPPQGNKQFIGAMSDLLRSQFGWEISPDNIALTNGSQSAFFILFNIFGGSFDDVRKKKILLPLAPEYIGYSDVGLSEELFAAVKPVIEHIDEHIFKYHIDFNKISITDEVGAICVSRPTNPTGNVLTDSEIERLSELARSNDIPLIIDNAYGNPFPNIIFTQAEPFWGQNVIISMSLSKLGLPSARTGILIARKEVISLVSRMNAVVSLSPGGIGAALVRNLIQSGEIIRLSNEIIKPFYQTKAERTVEQLLRELDGLDFHIHKPEGAFFVWLWFRGMPISDVELYERLKTRGVIIVPGRYFFPGLSDDWKHMYECIRLNYGGDQEIVAAGIEIIAEEVKRAYADI